MLMLNGLKMQLMLLRRLSMLCPRLQSCAFLIGGLISPLICVMMLPIQEWQEPYCKMGTLLRLNPGN